MTDTLTAPSDTSPTTRDEAEVSKFEALASEWWNPTGKFRTLHKFNPVRLTFIRDEVCAHFDRSPRDRQPFKGLRILDIGCGGGLLSEPMARLGAEVIGADAAARNIEIAKIHAERSGVAVDYRATIAEALNAAGEKFDVILNMEVVEHVADVDLFMTQCAAMVKPGGLMFVATLNRTPKSFALAIVGAEYVLKWLPRGTHEWDKFVTPDELETALDKGDMDVVSETGVAYNLLADTWDRSSDMDVNYMVLATKKPR
ncbi:MAG: bifunctional 2-polyprenyl-6-hydroxyphenol methylase/3-demethylubiquinol 3-O-methyltransferase UbiG [Pseudomonadota bacterium]